MESSYSVKKVFFNPTRYSIKYSREKNNLQIYQASSALNHVYKLYKSRDIAVLDFEVHHFYERNYKTAEFLANELWRKNNGSPQRDQGIFVDGNWYECGRIRVENCISRDGKSVYYEKTQTIFFIFKNGKFYSIDIESKKAQEIYFLSTFRLVLNDSKPKYKQVVDIRLRGEKFEWEDDFFNDVRQLVYNDEPISTNLNFLDDCENVLQAQKKKVEDDHDEIFLDVPTRNDYSITKVAGIALSLFSLIGIGGGITLTALTAANLLPSYCYYIALGSGAAGILMTLGAAYCIYKIYKANAIVNDFSEL